MEITETHQLSGGGREAARKEKKKDGKTLAAHTLIYFLHIKRKNVLLQISMSLFFEYMGKLAQ